MTENAKPTDPQVTEWLEEHDAPSYVWAALEHGLTDTERARLAAFEAREPIIQQLRSDAADVLASATKRQTLARFADFLEAASNLAAIDPATEPGKEDPRLAAFSEDMRKYIKESGGVERLEECVRKAIAENEAVRRAGEANARKVSPFDVFGATGSAGDKPYMITGADVTFAETVDVDPNEGRGSCAKWSLENGTECILDKGHDGPCHTVPA